MEITKNSGLSMNLLAENKKVIPIYFKNGDVWHTSIKMPDIVVRNNSSSETFRVKEVFLLGFAQGKKVVSFRQDEDNIKRIIQDANKLLNRFIQKPENHWRVYNLHMLFGDVPLTQDSYEESNQLRPSTVTCMRLQDLFCFLYAGQEKVDEINCQVKLASETDERIIETPIPLTPYSCKGDYIFPVRGNATIVGTPWNQVLGHRMASSQEFAFDVVDYRRGEHGEFVLSSPPNSSNVDDYYFFEREVLAIGDGTVAEAGNQWPNQWVENPLNYSEERIVELTIKLLEEGVNFNHAILGNYVIIDHKNGEFSLYAHMSEDTLTVQVGDVVKQGQVIGKVGNTSNSDFPHLHFHLMDSEDFQRGNGLPVMFKNLPSGQDPIYDFKGSNSLLYSDYLFVHTSD
jgi:hypothetical protein